MRLSLSTSCITLSISENSHNYSEITTLLASFSKSFWINNTLINLATKKELWSRKKFLLDLYKRCSLYSKKHNGHFLKKLMDAHDKPIKLIVKETTTPVKQVKISLKNINRILHVKFDNDEKFMFWYFINHFKKFNPNYKIEKKEIRISMINKELEKKLYKFLSQENILGNHMVYEYKKIELLILFNKKYSYKYANNTLENASLEYHYKILNVKGSDSTKEIRKQYIRLAKRFHPDHQGHLKPHEAKLNISRFHKIQKAYETIKEYRSKTLAA